VSIVQLYPWGLFSALAIAALREELAKLQAQAATSPKDPITGALLDGKLAGQIQSVQNQLTLKEGQAAVSGTQSATLEAQQLAAPYLKAFDDINQAWLNVQHQLITGNKSSVR
jgi:hypothetical protein